MSNIVTIRYGSEYWQETFPIVPRRGDAVDITHPTRGRDVFEVYYVTLRAGAESLPVVTVR